MEGDIHIYPGISILIPGTFLAGFGETRWMPILPKGRLGIWVKKEDPDFCGETQSDPKAGKRIGHKKNKHRICSDRVISKRATAAVPLPLSPDIGKQEHRTHKLVAPQPAAAVAAAAEAVATCSRSSSRSSSSSSSSIACSSSNTARGERLLPIHFEYV